MKKKFEKSIKKMGSIKRSLYQIENKEKLQFNEELKNLEKNLINNQIII
jgi:hypothetical protein